MRTAMLSSILGLLLPFWAIAQVEVPYSTLQWINPEEELQPMPDGYNGFDNQFGHFCFLADSTFVVSGAVFSPENGVDWFKVYHNTYDLNFQFKEAVYAGKTPLYDMNSNSIEFRSTKRHLVDINGYCTGDQNNCDRDSFRLICTIYNSNLDAVVIDTIGKAIEVNSTQYYENPNFVSAITFPSILQNIKPLVWFDDMNVLQGKTDASEFVALPPNHRFLGFDEQGFYFLTKESLGSSEIYSFQLYQGGLLNKSFVVDTLLSGVVSDIKFIKNTDGTFLLQVKRSLIGEIIKISPDFQLLWRQQIDIPEQGFLRRECLKTYENQNLVRFVLPNPESIRLSEFSFDDGALLRSEIIYSFSASSLSQVRPIENTDGIWFYTIATTIVEGSGFVRLYKINESEPAISLFSLMVPPLEGQRRWQFEGPVFIGDTLVLYGYYDREFSDFENVPQAHFLAKYYLPQVSDLKNVHSAGQFQIAPNPASHQISLLNLPAEPLGVHVIDLQGRILYSGHSHRQSSIDLPVEQLSPGIYFVSVQGANGVSTQKFIKH